MNKKTYEALKRIIGYLREGDVDLDSQFNKELVMVETWIDEAEKNYKKEIERKRKNTKRRHDLWKRQLGIKTWKEHRKEKGLTKLKYSKAQEKEVKDHNYYWKLMLKLKEKGEKGLTKKEISWILNYYKR